MFAAARTGNDSSNRIIVNKRNSIICSSWLPFKRYVSDGDEVKTCNVILDVSFADG